MKSTPLLIAVLATAAASAHADPVPPNGITTTTFKFDIGTALGRKQTVRLWQVEPVFAGATQLVAGASPLNRPVYGRRWELKLTFRGDVNWLGLVTDQVRLDGLMHLKRMFEAKTVKEVYGQKHFEGYVKGLEGYWNTGPRWEDGDPFIINNVNHPFMGSLSSLIYTNNDRRCRDIVYGDPGYWSCIRRATTYSAVASANWEWNPLMSETALGQVGKHHSCVKGNCTGEGGWTDLVMTPMGGMGIRIAGDIARAKLWPIFDRHLSGSKAARILNVALKIASNPSRIVNRALSLDFAGALSSPSRPRR